MNCNLVLHCGARAVERTALDSVVTPVATATWQPIPHLRLVEQVDTALTSCPFHVVDQPPSLSATISPSVAKLSLRESIPALSSVIFHSLWLGQSPNLARNGKRKNAGSP